MVPSATERLREVSATLALPVVPWVTQGARVCISSAAGHYRKYIVLCDPARESSTICMHLIVLFTQNAAMLFSNDYCSTFLIK